jgi:dTDP-4-dehydrorhamnose reductase
LRKAGITASDLEDIVLEPCAPDLVGVNYYVTSDRHIDHRLARYPTWTHGTNGRDRYADVEAVRVRRGIVGHERLLKEVWKRYATPIAITESHLGAAPEDQARWLARTWRDAQTALASGVDVRAVTLWSAFGAFDWDSLVTRRAGHYEPGAFDVRAPTPMPTAVAVVARELATHGEPRHPLASSHGWWLRNERLLYEKPASASRRVLPCPDTPPIVVTGAEGLLGRTIVALCRKRGLAVCALSRARLDVTDDAGVDRTIEALRPWLVIHCAGCLRVGDLDVSDSSNQPLVVNAHAPAHVARACAKISARALFFMSAFVFGKLGGGEFFENDEPAPSTALGRQHAAAERSIFDALPTALLVRTGPVFGYSGAIRINPPDLGVGDAARSDHPLKAWPSYAPMLAAAALDLAVAQMSGVIHLAHSKEIPLDAGRLQMDDHANAIALVSRRVGPMPELTHAYEDFVQEGSRLGIAA